MRLVEAEVSKRGELSHLGCRGAAGAMRLFPGLAVAGMIGLRFRCKRLEFTRPSRHSRTSGSGWMYLW